MRSPGEGACVSLLENNRCVRSLVCVRGLGIEHLYTHFAVVFLRKFHGQQNLGMVLISQTQFKMAPESFMIDIVQGGSACRMVGAFAFSSLLPSYPLFCNLSSPVEEMPGIYIDMCVCEEGELISPVLDSADCAESELSIPYFSSLSELAWNLK